MELLEFSEVQDTLQQLNYTNVQKEKTVNFYRALDGFGNVTKFQAIRQGKDLRIVNLSILESMDSKENIKIVDVEFISDLGFKIYVNDFIKDKKIKPNYEVDGYYSF